MAHIREIEQDLVEIGPASIRVENLMKPGYFMPTRTLIQQIRDRYDQRRPLNITAVRRECPDLLVEAMQQKPYLGWRGAIQQAGCDYKNIVIHIEETIPCQICGKEFAILTGHIMRKHTITPCEYLQEFPGSETTSERFRASKMTLPKASFAPPHWEPLWSAEYVADRTYWYHTHGHPIHYFAVAQFERALTAAALEFWGKWDTLLERMHLDPTLIRETPAGASLSPSQVIYLLNARKASGQSLAVTRVAADHLQLWNAAKRRFGSYHNAIAAAGLAPELLRTPQYNDAQMFSELAECLEQLDPSTGPPIREKWDLFVRQRGGWYKILHQFGIERYQAEDAGLLARRYRTQEDVIRILVPRRNKHVKTGVLRIAIK